MARLRSPRNRILAALSATDLEVLSRDLTEVELEERVLLFDYDRPIEFLYFPEDCVVSIVGIMADGAAVETATVGNEGMVGLPVFLGADRMPAQAFCQIPGRALRISADAFRHQIATQRTLASLLGRYAQAMFTLVAQSSACNRLHAARERCARWLLQMHDRVGRETFPLTQRFLSHMVGVRRATVTGVARELQDERLVEYRYGRMTILNRTGLERASCECYHVVRREFMRLLEGRRTADPLRHVRVSRAGRTTVGDAKERSARTARSRKRRKGSR